MNRFLFPYAYEIAIFGGVQQTTRMNYIPMFGENLLTYEPGKPVHYEGADVDYDAIAPKYQAMTTAEQAQARMDLEKAMDENIEALTDAFDRGDKAEFLRILFAYEAEEEKRPEYILYRAAWDIWQKALEDGTGLDTAMTEWCKTSPEFQALSADKQDDEKEWFTAKVVFYDQGLSFCVDQGNRALFEDILASR